VVLDLLVDDRGAVVVNAAHAGVSSGASVRAAWLKPYLGRAAYPVATTLAGALADGVAMRVDVDEQTIHEGPVLLLAVMNDLGPRSGGHIRWTTIRGPRHHVEHT
jgi:diacylglycerol kinase family enzyme